MNNTDGGSFKDPSGYVFYKDGHVYRVINEYYRSNYDTLINSGLYSDLLKCDLIVRHEEVAREIDDVPGAYKIIKPEMIPFISYPLESTEFLSPFRCFFPSALYAKL